MVPLVKYVTYDELSIFPIPMKEYERMRPLDNISILIPFTSKDESRMQVHQWIIEFYQTMLPGAEICIGHSDGTPVFSKSKAVNNAALQATRDIFVIADSDIIFEPTLIPQSVKLLQDHPWVIPYQRVFNLDQESTNRLFQMEPTWPIPFEFSGSYRHQMGWGGVNIVPRKHFESVGGFDERFQGWGGEDDAFAFSLQYVCGEVRRINASIFHLWHAPAQLINYGSNLNYLKLYLAGRESILQQIEIRKQLKT